MNEPKRKIICQRCKGTGKVKHPIGHPGRVALFRCVLCAGEGVLETTEPKQNDKRS